MHILYVLYDSFKSNSAIHVHNFANAMCDRGHTCHVAAENINESPEEIFCEPVLYKPIRYEDCTKLIKPDIVHGWTPRETVRNQFNSIKKQYPDAIFIIHLEDNEESILKAFTGYPYTLLKILPDYVLKRMIPPALSHPRQYKRFLKSVDGVSIIMDTLAKFAPNASPSLLLWPIIDCDLFKVQDETSQLKEKLGIKKNEVVIAYTGNVHSTNVKEVESLYKAVAMANEKGMPVRLIRTGVNHWDFLKNTETGPFRYSIELGYVERRMIPVYLSMADILVQPGEPDVFNDYRLPSKIPEFLSMGKPVVLPNSNIGRFLEHNEEAFLLQSGDEEEIFKAIHAISTDPALAKRLSRGAYQFSQKHFDKEKIASRLERFYQEVSNG